MAIKASPSETAGSGRVDVKWLRRIYERIRAHIPPSAQRRRINAIQDELFQIPSLPPINFLANPLGDRLTTARQEMSEFLAEEDDISDEEHQYLLMQMFFRGPMNKVREELRTILNSIEIEDSVQSLPVWDIGCGRGELLEILNEAGFNAVGIDTSALMIKKLNELNLQARHGDAIEELKQAPENSLCGITAFHVIEHMPFKTVVELLQLSYQKLAPGGFLLLETPNPFCFESLSYFYTDQTHVRPIQPYQLAFAVETAGFTETRLHFTAPVPASRKQAHQTWMRLYQNHGIVAKKPMAKSSSLKEAA